MATVAGLARPKGEDDYETMSVSATILATAVLGQSVSISDVYQPGLKDASFTAQVEKAVIKELSKINKDFASSYRVKKTEVQLKEPFKMRLVSKVEGNDIVFVLNGPSRLLKVSPAGIRNKENLSKSPGKRQTLFDYGLLTPSLFNNFFVAKFVRMDRATGNAVFDVTYVPSLDDTTRHRIWVDTSKKYMTRREWYSQNGGNLMATFEYSNPKQFGGVWIPLKLSVSNAERKFAGSLVYSNVKVNTGLADSLFVTN